MLSDLFYREPRLTALTVAFIAVAGVSGLQSLSRQEDPALSRRFGEVEVRYPGATAERVEALVTERIENELQELHEIKTIESIARTGSSYTRIELEDAYDEEVVDEIWSRVRDKLADVAPELPEGASTPAFEDQTSTAVTLLVGFRWEGEGEPQLALMTRLAEELENRLRVLPGTKETELYGEADEEIRVTVDPLRLAEVGLDAASVGQSIASADTKRPAGQLRQGGAEIPLEVEGELASVDRVRRVPLRSDTGGQLLRVGDIADVEKTRSDPPSTIAILAGARGVAVSATMLPGSGRVDLWAERARGVIEEFASEVPPGIGYRVLFDQSEFTVERLSTLVRNLVLGALIVVLVLFVMMGLRSALIVASILPLTIAMVLAELNAFGVPLHQISVTGLIIALGMLIDNAIVVVDEYELRRARGAEVGAAIRAVVGDLFVPLGVSTLTTVLAFLPIVLMPGAAGEFVGTISVSVGLAVTTSFLLSMTLILAFAGRFDAKPHPEHGGRGIVADGYSNAKLTALFRRGIVRVVERPLLGVGVALVLPILGFWGGSTLPEQFFPANDRNQFQLQIALPAHTPIDATRAAAERARLVVDAHDEVIESHWFAGEMAPRVYYNMMGSQNVPSYAGAFVVTRSSLATEQLLPKLQRELTESFPEAIAIALPFEQGPPFDAPIEVRVVGPDIDQLRSVGDDIRRVLAQTHAVTFTKAKLEGGRPKLLVTANEDAAELVGLRLGDVADQLNAAFEGASGGRVIESSEELPIRVRVGSDARGSIARIASTRLLPGPSGGTLQRGALAGVPLEAVAGIELRPELSGIERRNGERINTLQAYLVPFTLISESLADFMARFEAAEIELPPGYRIELGGETELRSEALGNLAAFALPLFIVMTGAIILTFNSFRMAGIIFAVAFLSVGLALGGVFMFGHPMGFMAIVGTMGLVGLAINDAIVVLSALRNDPRSAEAEPEATADVVVDATRHVVATTLTTVGGFTPLIAFGGRFWPPMATAIAGGVIGASILALYFVPAMYAVVRRRHATPAMLDEQPAPAELPRIATAASR